MKISTKILSVLIAFTIIFTAIPFSASAKTVAELNAEIDALEKKQAANDAEQKDTKKEIERLQEISRLLDQKIDALESEMVPIQKNIDELTAEIDEYEKRIEALEAEIKDINDQVDEQNVEIGEAQELLKKRMRATYMAGETSELEIFLSATDFSDFLARTEFLRQVAERDTAIINSLQDLVNQLEAMIDNIEVKRDEIDEKQAAVEADRAEHKAEMAVLEVKKKDVEISQSENEANLKKQNTILEKYNQEDAYYQSLIEKAEQEKAQFSASLDQQIGSSGSTGNGIIDNGPTNHSFRKSSSGFICPLQDGAVRYSATFASHSARGTASVDFVAPKNRVVNGKTYYTTKGAKLYAAASGVVTKSTYAASTYGHYVNIDHGNGMSSLCAHMDARYVAVGTRVTQGQVIGLCGNTGNCWPRPSASNPVAGSHLHFEMRKNGSRVNPELYMPYPLI